MKAIDDDTLQAYVDGELDAADAARIEAALVTDDVLRRRVRRAHELRAQLKAAFDPVLDEPIPGHLSALLQTPAANAHVTAAPDPGRAARRGFGAPRHRTSRRWLVPGAAVAASIAVLAVALWWNGGSESVRIQGSQQFAAGALSHALDQGLASAPDPHATVAIGLTFRSADGHICRTFVQHSQPAMAGLACHHAAGWTLPVLSTPEKSAGGELRQAASTLPPQVQAAVDARLQGEVFDAQQERAARDSGWR
ncbi:MAG: zf-HC2 domain-containing protein [Pseudomonadota bacterium]|nr:zf-HC2 domain-containing protein [Pseudomonadota bacterium]